MRLTLGAQVCLLLGGLQVNRAEHRLLDTPSCIQDRTDPRSAHKGCQYPLRVLLESCVRLLLQITAYLAALFFWARLLLCTALTRARAAFCSSTCLSWGPAAGAQHRVEVEGITCRSGLCCRASFCTELDSLENCLLLWLVCFRSLGLLYFLSRGLDTVILPLGP